MIEPIVLTKLPDDSDWSDDEEEITIKKLADKIFLF